MSWGRAWQWLLCSSGSNSTQADTYAPPAQVLLRAVRSNNVEVIRNIVLQPRFDINNYEFDGTCGNHSTLLHEAVFSNSLEICQLLIDRGADVNRPSGDDYSANILNHSQLTALHLACFMGGEEIVKLLLRAGADINRTTEYRYLKFIYKGATPMEFAVRRGHLSIVKLLCDHGYNLHANDTKEPFRYAEDSYSGRYERLFARKTLLMSAIQDHRWDVAEFLITKGVDLEDFEPSRTDKYPQFRFATDKDIMAQLFTLREEVFSNHGLK
jgi:hypothetical protein